MKTELRVVGLIFAATVVAVGEMQTWTFEKTAKTIKGEVAGFVGETVTLKLPDGKTVSVPIAYLTETNRAVLAEIRAKEWKEVEIVKLLEAVSAGRYKKCAVKGKDVSGEILIQRLPASLEAILNKQKQQAAEIADLAYRIENRDREVQRADAVTPRGAYGDLAYVDRVMAQRGQVNLAIVDVEQAKSDLAKRQAAYAGYVSQTKDARMVKVKNTGLVYQALPVWECADPRKSQH